MRAHGITPSTTAVKPASTRTPKTERRDSKGQPHKKRKASAFAEDNPAADDEENFSGIKPDPSGNKEQLTVKEEAGQLSLAEATNLMQYYNTPSYDSRVGGNEAYSQTGYDSGPSSYHTTISAPYGLQGQQSYDFSFPSTPMSNGSTALEHGIQYQPMMHFASTDNQGGSESPLIVD
jgi:hypothetical protein